MAANSPKFTIKQIEDMCPNQSIDIENLHIVQLRDKLISLNYHFKTKDNILVLLKSQNETNEIKTAISQIEKSKTEILKSIKTAEDQLSQITKFRNNYFDTLKIPDYGDTDDFDIKYMRLSIPTFSNKEGEISLKHFWMKCMNYSKQFKLSEKAIKDVLSNALHGEPYKVFFENQDESLEKILSALGSRFGDFKSIPDYIKTLDEIKRLPGENISSLMNRVQALINKTAAAYPENERETRHELLMTQFLLKLCSKRALNGIQLEREKCSRQGIILNYSQLFALARDIESYQEKYAPETYASNSVCIESCDDDKYYHNLFRQLQDFEKDTHI